MGTRFAPRPASCWRGSLQRNAIHQLLGRISVMPINREPTSAVFSRRQISQGAGPNCLDDDFRGSPAAHPHFHMGDSGPRLCLARDGHNLIEGNSNFLGFGPPHASPAGLLKLDNESLLVPVNFPFGLGAGVRTRDGEAGAWPASSWSLSGPNWTALQ